MKVGFSKKNNSANSPKEKRLLRILSAVSREIQYQKFETGLTRIFESSPELITPARSIDRTERTTVWTKADTKI